MTKIKETTIAMFDYISERKQNEIIKKGLMQRPPVMFRFVTVKEYVEEMQAKKLRVN